MSMFAGAVGYYRRYRPGIPDAVAAVLDQALGRGSVAEFGGDTPLGRVGQPAELAPAFVFFASPESSFVTGEVLAVTGGKPLH